MIDFESIQRYWGDSRRKRRISVNRLSAQLSEKMGYPITQHQLENFEYKGHKPNPDVWKGIERQVKDWLAEDRVSDARVKEEAEIYGFAFSCPGCHGTVPGPNVGAFYCMLCGNALAPQVCNVCSFTELRPEAKFCLQCGSRFEKKEVDDGPH